MKLFHADTFTLKNGLQVVVIPNKLTPAVSIGVLYKVGTADDPQDLTGVSHFLEHMMFKGTKKVPNDKLKKEINAMGGDINATTFFDWTFYTTTISKTFLPHILEKEADRMVNLAYKEKEVVAERSVVHQERLMRIGNHPFGHAYELFLHAQYLYHPYRKEPIGDPADIDRYNFENTYAWYKRWYAPNNAVLIISGNITADEMKKLAQHYFGSLKPSKDIPDERIRAQDPEVKIPTTQYIVQKNERNSTVTSVMSYPSPSKKTAKSAREFYAYMIVGYMLGGNSTSLFYNEFVMKNNHAVSVSSHYHFGYDPMKFEVEATLTPDMSYNAFYDAYKKYLKDLVENVIESDMFAQKFEDAKNQIIGNMRFDRDGTSNAVKTFTLLAQHFSVEDIDNMPRHIEAVELSDVKHVIKTLFAQDPEVVLIVCPPDYSIEVLA